MRSEVRIIGGKWRKRRLSVPDVPHLRPTPDRVRETLFNWLINDLPSSRCLDAFAGTGVLGFEALSRGAAFVEMVDSNAIVIKTLKEAAHRLQSEDDLHIYLAKIPQGLKKPERAFDIVFLDPPYQSDLLLKTCHYLEDQHFLASRALIYLEADHVIEDNDLPRSWRIIKAEKAGQVYFHLAYRELNNNE